MLRSALITTIGEVRTPPIAGTFATAMFAPTSSRTTPKSLTVRHRGIGIAASTPAPDPGERTKGAAETLEEARIEFEAAWS